MRGDKYTSINILRTYIHAPSIGCRLLSHAPRRHTVAGRTWGHEDAKWSVAGRTRPVGRKKARDPRALVAAMLALRGDGVPPVLE